MCACTRAGLIHSGFLRAHAQVFFGSDMARVALADPSLPAALALSAVDMEEGKGLLVM